MRGRLRRGWLVIGAALGALAGAAQAHAQGAAAKPPVRTLYAHLNLIDGTGAPVRPDMAILVEGETIRAVGPSAAMQAQAGDARLVDGKGGYVLPGMINSHEHLATPPDRAFAEAMMKRDLYGGVTAVRDMADDLRSIAELARASRLGEIPGPDIYFAALMAGPEFFEDKRTIAAAMGETPGKVPWMQAITPQTDMKLAVAMARGTGASAIKVYADLEPDVVRAIVAEAHRQGMPIWAHAMIFPTTPREGIEAGVDVASHSCMLAYEASDVKPRAYHKRAPVDETKFAGGDSLVVESLLQEMKARGVILDATNYVYASMAQGYAKAGGKGPRPYCSEALAEKITGWAWRDGVQVSAGTDGFSPSTDAWPALQGELELLVDKVGMSPLDAIRSATLVGARAAGREKEMGSIEPGKLANLVFVSADPSRDIRALRHITLVVKRGRAYPRTDYRPLKPGQFKDQIDD